MHANKLLIPLACLLLWAGQTVQAQCPFVYASPTGSPLNDGSEANPVDLQTALTQACSQSRPHIRLLSGTYTVSSKLVIGCNDVVLDGDWEVVAGVGRKNNSLTTVININSPLETAAFDGAAGTTVGFHIGVQAISRTGFRINDIAFNVKNGGAAGTVAGTTLNRGNSVYGFYFRACSGWTVERCIMNTGSGSNGNPGVAGSAGANGGNGTNGNTGDCDDDSITSNAGDGGSGAGGAAGGGGGNSSGTTAGVGGVAGAAGSLRTGGGGGGGGTGGSENRSGGRGGNGGAAGGAAGTGGNGGNGNNTSGAGTCSVVNGFNGGNGGIGATGAAGAVLATSSNFNFYWEPSGQSGTGADGTGGGGGAGGGGGGGQGSCGFFCTDGTGSSGGGGGGGGQGGVGGTGGFGGGGSFGLYAFGGTGSRIDLTLNTGLPAVGGTGGNGGAGGNGGFGGIDGGLTGNLFGCSSCEVGFGGNGGNGGRGGNGGAGGNGAAGRSDAFQLVGGATAPVTTTTAPAPTITNQPLSGCSNSEILITKSSGTWTMPAGAAFLPDLTASTSSYSPSSPSAIISYANTGYQGVIIDGVLETGFVNIQTARPLPTFASSMPTTVCEGQNFLMSTPTPGTSYEWVIFAQGTNTATPVFVATTAVANWLTPLTGSTANYTVRLRVQNTCCGWSTPVYFNFSVVAGSVAPTVTGASICAGQSANIIGTGNVGNNVNFFSDALGQITLQSTLGPNATFTTPSLFQNTTYYVSQGSAACPGGIASVEVTVTQPPLMPTASNIAVCAGTSVTLQATGSVTGNLLFYNSAFTQLSTTPITLAAPNASFNVGALAAGSYTFYARQQNGATGCFSDYLPILVNVNAVPAAPAASGVSICAGSIATVSATGTSIRWYADAGLTNQVGTGNGFTTAPLSANTSLFATTTNANGCQSPATTVVVTVNALPSTPTPTNASVCSGFAATLTSSSAGGTTRWFSDANALVQVGSTATFTTPALTTSTTYFVRETSTAGCLSGLGVANVTVNPLPSAPLTNNVSVCAGNNLVFNATGAGGTLSWFNVATGGVALGTGNNYNAGALAAGTYTFYVSENNGTCNSAPRTAVLGTVFATPTAPAASNVSICSGSMATITATGASIRWYSDAALSTQVATGNSFTTPMLTAQTNYFLTSTNANNCASAVTTVTVFINSIPSATTFAPPSVCFNSAPTTITVTPNAGTTLDWYNAPVVSPSTFISTGATLNIPTLSQNTDYYFVTRDLTTGCLSPITRYNVTVLPKYTTPIVSNLAVCEGEDVILSANTNGYLSGIMTFRQAPSFQSDVTVTAASLPATTNVGVLAVGTHTYEVLQRGGTGFCPSDIANIVVTVNPAPAAPVAANVTICSGASATLQAAGTNVRWYSDAALSNQLAAGNTFSTPVLTASTDYFVTVRNANNCESAATTVTAVVNPLPATPTLTGASVCAGTTASISSTSTGGTIRWYADGAISNLLGAGTTFTTPAVSANTSFFAQETDLNGCKSAVASVVVTVNPLPAAPLANNASVCAGNDLILSAVGNGGTLSWFNVATGGAALGTGTSFNAGTLAAGNYTFYVSENNGTCNSAPRTAVLGTVNASPAGVTASNVSICSGASATLIAAGASVRWYSDALLVNQVGVGNTFMTPALTSNTNYYATTSNSFNCQSSASTVSVSIYANPTAPVVTNTTVCEGSAATLTAASTGGTLSWFSDATGANLLTTGNSYSVSVVNQNTSFFVRETNANGCNSPMAVASIAVSTLPNPPNAQNINVCAGAPIVLSATGSGVGELIFYNSADLEIFRNTMSTASRTVTFTNPSLAAGSYLFSAREGLGACLSTPATIVVQVRALPTAPVANNDGAACVGDDVLLSASTVPNANYIWTGVSGFSRTGQTVLLENVAANQAGTYQVQVILNGCTSTSASTVVTVNARPSLTGAISNNTPICEGTTLNLTAPSATPAGVVYRWSNTNGFTFTGASVVINNVNEIDHQGLYTVVATNPNTGCQSLPLSTLAQIDAIPSGGLVVNNSPICEGGDIQFLTSQIFGATYSWSGPNGFVSTDRAPIIASATTATEGSYSLTISVGNCSAVLGSDVDILTAPQATIIPDTATRQGENLQLYATGGTVYRWAATTYLSDPQSATPVFSGAPVGTYIYSVFITSASGCTVEKKVNIEVRPSLNPVFVDLFTPNGDGVNDTWEIGYLQNFAPYSLSVYSRGGFEVYRTDDYQNNWDGKRAGQDLPDGTYWYVLRTQDREYKGAVTIKR